MYALYASSVSDESVMKSVTIRGADGTQFKYISHSLFFFSNALAYSVANLAKPKSGTTYVLDESNTLIAPITVHPFQNLDVQEVLQISFSPSQPLSPLTIYIVNADREQEHSNQSVLEFEMRIIVSSFLTPSSY